MVLRKDVRAPCMDKWGSEQANAVVYRALSKLCRSKFDHQYDLLKGDLRALVVRNRANFRRNSVDQRVDAFKR